MDGFYCCGFSSLEALLDTKLMARLLGEHGLETGLA